MKIMGTKFFGHDSAIAVLDFEKKDIFAISTERITRIKHDDFDITPILSEYNFNDIQYVCHSFCKNEDQTYKDRYYGLLFQDKFRKIFKPRYRKDIVEILENKYSLVLKAFVHSPLDVIELLYYYYKINFYKKFDESFYLNKLEKLMLKKLAKNNIFIKNIDFIDHHLSHSLGAYYLSPFAYNGKDTLVLTLDGFGDGNFSTLSLYNGNTYNLISNSEAPKLGISSPIYIDIASIGVIYSNFTVALGLVAGSDEGKVEALAAFGKPDEKLYNDLMEVYNIVDKKFILNSDKILKFYHLDYLHSEINRVGKENFASSLQKWLEDIVVNYMNHISSFYPNISQLALSGGVTANIIMNLNIFERTNFKKIYILPPMGDEGGAIGSAIKKALDLKLDISWLKEKSMPYFGDKIDLNQIEYELDKFNNIKYKKLGESWYKEAAKSVANNKVIAVVQGRMEFGPRALGNRSIIANPTNKNTKDRINSTVKRRPHYQPFCPSILEEEREKLFENSFHHKHMAIAFRMKEEFSKKLPSAVHIDNTARPQFVTKDDNEGFYNLLKEVKKLTGFGVVINTSFNLHGRTIVRTVKDAVIDFIDCNIDELYIEGYKIWRD